MYVEFAFSVLVHVVVSGPICLKFTKLLPRELSESNSEDKAKLCTWQSDRHRGLVP